MSIGKTKRPIRVLVADDSALARDLISSILNSEPDIEVAGEAVNGLEAVAKVTTLKPDLVTMDIEMPILDGMNAIERIMRDHPVPILVVSAHSDVHSAFSAVAKGAMDVVEKPDIDQKSAQNIVKKVRMLSNIDMAAYLAAKRGAAQRPTGRQSIPKQTGKKATIIAIAASLGGPQAIHSILLRLPSDFPAPILIAQHIADGFTQGMVEWLKSGSLLRVCELRQGEKLLPGTVYINPAEFSVTAIRRGEVIFRKREPDERYHPSCDALLSNVAKAYQTEAVGVILSGMGKDGVEGMEAIKTGGGITIAQDAQSSVVNGMNRLAVERGFIDRVMPLIEIPLTLVQLVRPEGEKIDR